MNSSEPEEPPSSEDDEPDPEDLDFEEDEPSEDEDFIDDEFSLPSFDSEDDKKFFDSADDDDLLFEDAFDDFELCDDISEPPSTPPMTPDISDDECSFDDMSFCSEPPCPPEGDWPSFSDDECSEAEDEVVEGDNNDEPPTDEDDDECIDDEEEDIPEETTMKPTRRLSRIMIDSITHPTMSSTHNAVQSTSPKQSPLNRRKLPPPPPPPPTRRQNDTTDSADSATISTDNPAYNVTNTTVDNNVNSDNTRMIPICEHPSYVKYYKMLKYGLPLPTVKTKMQHDGYCSDRLECAPSELILANTVVEKFGQSGLGVDEHDSGEKVTYAEHVTFGRYFKMLKFGLSVDAVKTKLTQEGFDPKIIDNLPTDLVSAKAVKPNTVSGTGAAKLDIFSGRKKSTSGAAAGIEGGDSATSAVKDEPKIRKKKLFWKGVDSSKMSADSLWATQTGDGDIKLDQEEFNMLFTEKTEVKGAVEIRKTTVVKVVKPKGIHLIDLKRAQNAAIALSRIKIPYNELRAKLNTLNDDHLSTDQLISLCEYMPNTEEQKILAKYTGDVTLLGQAEKYMLAMLNFPTANQNIGCMIYKQLFANRQHECKSKLSKIESACDDVKLSARLKKVLKIILKVGNTLNDNADNKGFSVDSLLKLKDAKAFDKKTSILQYVIILIHRNDPDALLFPDDLQHINDASRLILDAIGTEKNTLKAEFDANANIVLQLQKQLEDCSDGNDVTIASTAVDFYTSKALQQCEDLDKRYQKVKAKFQSVLTYFGEDPNLSSTEFFTTLNKFIQEYIVTRDNVERLRKAEERKKKAMSMPRVMKAKSVMICTAVDENSTDNMVRNGEDVNINRDSPKRGLRRCSTVGTMESTASVSEVVKELG